MTEDDLNAHEGYITEGEVAAWDDDFLARNGNRVTAVIRRAGLSAEAAIKEIRRLRAAGDALTEACREALSCDIRPRSPTREPMCAALVAWKAATGLGEDRR